MFSIQFCVCFYGILDVCHCHFAGNIYDKCTKTNEIKLEADLETNNRHEAIISQNTHTTVQYLAKNASKIYVDIDKRLIKVIPKEKKRMEKIKSTDNTHRSIIKKKYSIFGIDLTLCDLGNKKQLVTKKMINSDDYSIKNSIDKRNQSELIEDTGELTIPKNDTVVEQRTIIKNENITENMTNHFQINDMDKTVQKVDTLKNIENNDMTKSFQKYDSPTNVKQRIKLIEDTGEFTMPKNDIVGKKSTIIKNENITENMTKIFEIKCMDKTVQEDDLPKNVKQRSESIEDTGVTIHKNDTVEGKRTIIKNENITQNVTKLLRNYIMNKNGQKFDLPKNIKQPSELTEDTGEFTIPINEIVEKKSSIINHTNITENVTTIFQNNAMNKNLQKRDIGILENVVHNYNPEIFQNHDANNKYQKIDFHNKIENYDTPKNINHNFNAPYNYQNDETNYKNIIYKKDMLKKDKLTRRYDDNVSQNVRPQLQTRLNNNLVKKSLDEFTMIRRKTHYTMPDVDFKTNIDKHQIDYYQDVVYPKFQEYDNEATLNGVRNHVKPDHHVDDIRNNMYPIYGEINHIYNSYEERNEIKNFNKLNNLIERQKQIIEKLAKFQRNGKKEPKKTSAEVAGLDFDALVSEVKAKQEIYRKSRNYTEFTFETTPANTTTEKPTTILTLFDETEVRHALKNDPYVKRILKMANLKREKYLNNIRTYLTRHNYTQDTKYAKNLTESANGLRAEAEETTSFVDRVKREIHGLNRWFQT